MTLTKMTRFCSLPVIAMSVMTLMLGLQSCDHSSSKSLHVSGHEEFADSAQSTFRIFKDQEGRKVLVKNNTFYDLVDFIDRTDNKNILLKITKSETSIVDSTPMDSKFMVSAANVNDSKSSWTKELVGTEIDYTGKVLVVRTESKNPNEEDAYTQYSLFSGEKLMTYNNGQMMVFIPNISHKRFFGFLSKSSTIEKPENFAILNYVSSTEVIDKINFKVLGNTQVPLYTPEMTMLVAKDSGNAVVNDGRNVILAHAGRNYTSAEITNFALQISFTLPGKDEPSIIRLPIRNDHIDLEHAVYDTKVFDLSKNN